MLWVSVKSLGSFSKFLDILIIYTVYLKIFKHIKLTQICNWHTWQTPSWELKIPAFKMPEMCFFKMWLKYFLEDLQSAPRWVQLILFTTRCCSSSITYESSLKECCARKSNKLLYLLATVWTQDTASPRILTYRHNHLSTQHRRQWSLFLLSVVSSHTRCQKTKDDQYL